MTLHAGDGFIGHRVAGRGRLLYALALAGATAALEVWGSVVSGSLALLADATHVLTDVGALSIALGAVWLSGRPHTLRWTFGYHRVEVLIATLNGLLLLAVAAFVAWRAIDRLQSPSDIEVGPMLAVAAIGLVANAVALLILRESESVNVRAARLHILSDLGGSVAAVAGGLAIAATGQDRVDSVISLAIVVLVTVGAIRLLRETTAILMARVPDSVDLAEVDAALRGIDGVRAVHDMHCWEVTKGFVAFVAHLDVVPGAEGTTIVAEAADLLRERFGIEHVTIQPEEIALHDLEAPAERREVG
jgi:cobalt-zinc-cadmium efflux system protein